MAQEVVELQAFAVYGHLKWYYTRFYVDLPRCTTSMSATYGRLTEIVIITMVFKFTSIDA